MISARQVERLASLVEDAVERGARVVLAGGPVPGDGHFFAPVVLEDVPPDARVMREEIFGPIVAIAAFDSRGRGARAGERPRRRPRRVPLHLRPRPGDATRAGRSRREWSAINRGRVSSVAAPFGGVGHSGFGHSGGAEGIDEYLVTRYLTMPAAGGAW